MTVSTPTRPTTTTTTAHASTAYCPTCSRTLPADAFLDGVQDPTPDTLGYGVRCAECISEDLRAMSFSSRFRRAAKADPSSPLALQWTENRARRQRLQRIARAYAASLLEGAPLAA